MSQLITRIMQTELRSCAQSYPVTTLLGPRQSGKTTLAKTTFPDKPYVNLEAPDQRDFALSDPRRFLNQFPQGAILDEIQRTPELLSYIQVMVDEEKKNGLFILTGSHQLELQQEVSQSLAGRTGILHLHPLSLLEIKNSGRQYSLDDYLFNGGYPRIYEYNLQPARFYRDYVQTYLERDLKQIFAVKDLDQFQRFMYLCAARVGSTIDYTSMANDLGISRHTLKEWISVLKASFITFTLPPYFENFGKQIIKSSKLYFNDTGLLCHLLGIQEKIQLNRHPLRGQIFENFVITELIKQQENLGKKPLLFFYRDKHQNEVDIIWQKGHKLIAIEIKSSQTFNLAFLKGVKKFRQLAIHHETQGIVLYSGKIEQVIDDIEVINYEHIDRLDQL